MLEEGIEIHATGEPTMQRARKLSSPKGGWPSGASEYRIEDEPNRFFWIKGATKAEIEMGADAAGAAATHRWPNGIIPAGGRFIFALTGRREGCPTLFFDTGRVGP